MEQRLIDANALDKRIYNDIPISVFGSIKKMAAVREIIAEQPTVDAVPVEQIEAFIDWLERSGYTLLKKEIIKALDDYRADGERMYKKYKKNGSLVDADGRNNESN